MGQARVDVGPDQPASVAITLTANAVVIGRLVDPAGKPLAGQALDLGTITVDAPPAGPGGPPH